MKRFNSLCIKLSVVAMMLFLGAEAFAQKDVTKFMGIPVDGTREEMIRKLKEKGFTTNVEASEYANEEILKGEFNGENVNLYVVTNYGIVYRIMVSPTRVMDEASIKNHFNTLCAQFDRNPRYGDGKTSSNQEIPDDEDIYYGMTIDKKKYQAIFFQKPYIDENFVEKLVSDAEFKLIMQQRQIHCC